MVWSHNSVSRYAHAVTWQPRQDRAVETSNFTGPVQGLPDLADRTVADSKPASCTVNSPPEDSAATASSAHSSSQRRYRPDPHTRARPLSPRRVTKLDLPTPSPSDRLNQIIHSRGSGLRSRLKPTDLPMGRLGARTGPPSVKAPQHVCCSFRVWGHCLIGTRY